MPLADTSATVLTHAAPEETGRKANDNPCLTRFRPDTIASDLLWFENLRSALADVLAARVAVGIGLSGKAVLCLNSRIRTE
jgi:hypothetical protein